MKNFAVWPTLLLLLFATAGATCAHAKPTQKALDSALFAAIGDNDVKRAKSLLERGANVNSRDSEGNTALISASFIGDPQDETLRLHPIAFLQLLLKHGADVNLAGAGGETALMTAAQGSPRAVRLLLAKGALINAQTKVGQTALMRAVTWECEGPCSDPEVVRILLARGAKVNMTDENGETALIKAVHLSRYGPLTASDGLNMAKMLLARGADVCARTRNGNTALKWAKVGGNSAFVRLIERAQARK